MEQFNIVRCHKADRGYSNVPAKQRAIDTIQTFNTFPEALARRDELGGLVNQLLLLGVSFACQYDLEIEQVVTTPSAFGSTPHSRIIDLSERDQGIADVDDALFGASVTELLAEAAIAHGRTVINALPRTQTLNDEE